MKINRRGLIGTSIIHGLVLALLLLGGLTFPDPPPEEEGVLVNFGTDDSGFGSVEPQGDEVNQGTPEPEVTQSDPTPDPVENLPEVTTPPTTSNTAADNTQDVEEVVVKEDPQPTAEEIRQLQQQQQEAERIRKEQEAAEKLRREQEAERQRQLEEQQKRDQQANKLNAIGRNTFGNQGTGDQEGSEGVNPGTGNNQGTTSGTEGASNYGSGSGMGNGPSYGGLGNRNAVGDLPLPNVAGCEVTSRIVVTVEIQVDRSGNVVSATVLSATFSDKCIWDVVVEAAKKTKFTSDPNASFKQSGWIKYTIEP